MSSSPTLQLKKIKIKIKIRKKILNRTSLEMNAMKSQFRPF